MGAGRVWKTVNPGDCIMQLEVGDLIEGNLVDVRHREIYPARIEHADGVITKVERISGEFPGYLIPGLIDSHIHIESSLLCPSRFAEAVVPHGTTTVVTDPHEIANVLGLQGVEYMVKDSKTVPLRVYFTVPSCVPATPFETAGAVLGPHEIEQLLQREEFVALGEMMNYPGVVSRAPEVMAKIEAAKKAGKPVDGHCPTLSGQALRDYVSAGISTDHECISSEEAKEKYELGMLIMVRQGSASKNLAALAPFAKKHEFLLVSDDKNVADLMNGHMDLALADAVAHGIDPLHALRAATINPAAHYSLPVGVLEPGKKADVVKVSDLKSFKVEEVYISGELVAARGSPKFEAKPKEMINQFIVQRKIPSDFELMSNASEVEVRVIGLVRDEIVTEDLRARLKVANGKVQPDIENDVLRIAVVNRYRDTQVSNAFVKGFGLKSGAIASSVAHDSHNIIVVGTASDDMATAVNAIVSEGGGFCVACSGKYSMVNLRIAGLMCTKAAFDVKHMMDTVHAKAKELGCAPDNPFMSLSFLSLLVIPVLKIGDRGLFDVSRFEFVEPIVG